MGTLDGNYEIRVETSKALQTLLRLLLTGKAEVRVDFKKVWRMH